VVFEVQENSDVTCRLYDWDRADPKTGKPRPLQVEQAIACVDFEQVATGPVAPVVLEGAPAGRERLFHCEHFTVWRHAGMTPFPVGVTGTPRVLVSIVGDGELEHKGTNYHVGRGDVILLPAEVGACFYRPRNTVSLLEIALPV
jgi:mannose-6-phosphate isomerase